MKNFNKFKILTIILMSSIIMLFLNINISYASNTYYDSIVGYAYEESENRVGIPDIEVNLMDMDENIITTTRTNEEGKYEFRNIDTGNYFVNFKWGYVESDDIERIQNEDEAKRIQNIIKYNGQDYSSINYGDAQTNVQISIVLDKSNMAEENLEQEKELARTLIDYLLLDKILGETTNVEINLISFSDGVSEECGFTNNTDDLVEKIDNINVGGNNRTLEALQFTANNGNFNAENKIVLVLSNGLDSENRMQEIRDYTNSMKDRGIKIYSLFMGDNNLSDAAENYYENTKFLNINELDVTDLIENLANEVLNYIRVSLGYGEVMENDGRRNTINNIFSDFSYKNTVYFEAIDMQDVGSKLATFKEYANKLIENTYMEGYSNKICRITEKKDVNSEAISYEGPNLVLRKRPEAKLQQKLYMTGLRITGQDGSVIAEKTENFGSTMPLMVSEESSTLYGSTIQLEYTLYVKNESNMEDSGFNEIVLFGYLPKGFTYSGTFSFSGSVGDEIPQLLQITKQNINAISEEYYGEERYGIDKTNLYNEVVGQNKNGVFIRIIFNDENKKFNYGSEFIIKFIVSKLLTGEEDEIYQERAEVLGYSNESSRRMVGTIQSLTAGNGIKGEEDTVEFSNIGIIIPPTGGDKRKINICMIVCLLIISQISILILKNRKKH